VICVEACELFSALVDEALSSTERSSLEAHLATCADCPRELERFRATVALLQGLPRPRAPVGFVDRVLARARPEPWPRRLGRWLFVPLRAKLPMEAAAVALVAVVAVYLVHRVPEPALVARDGGSLQARRSNTPTEPANVPPTASPEGARAPTPPGAPGPSTTSPPIAAPAPSGAPPPTVPAAPSDAPPRTITPLPPVAAPGRASSSSRARAAPGDAADTATPPARPGTAGGGSRPTSPPPPDASTSVATAQPSAASPSAGANSTLQLRAKVAPPVAARDASGEKESGGPTGSATRSADQLAKTAEAPSGATGTVVGGSGSAAPLAMLERREAAPPALVGRLAATVSDPTRELALLASRLGGRSSVRRLDALGGVSRAVVDLEVPRQALGELRAGIERLGRWTPEGEPALAAPPAPSPEPGSLVRVQVTLVD
jgi:hypothetical protein